MNFFLQVQLISALVFANNISMYNHTNTMPTMMMTTESNVMTTTTEPAVYTTVVVVNNYVQLVQSNAVVQLSQNYNGYCKFWYNAVEYYSVVEGSTCQFVLSYLPQSSWQYIQMYVVSVNRADAYIWFGPAGFVSDSGATVTGSPVTVTRTSTSRTVRPTQTNGESSGVEKVIVNMVGVLGAMVMVM